MYFIFTSMAGIRNIGIWFFWIRVSIYYSIISFIFHILFIIESYIYNIEVISTLILKVMEN